MENECEVIRPGDLVTFEGEGGRYVGVVTAFYEERGTVDIECLKPRYFQTTETVPLEIVSKIEIVEPEPACVIEEAPRYSSGQEVRDGDFVLFDGGSGFVSNWTWNGLEWYLTVLTPSGTKFDHLTAFSFAGEHMRRGR